MRFAALQHRFTIEVEDATAAEHLTFVLGDLRTDGPTDTTYRIVHVDGWFDLTFEQTPVVERTTRGHAIAMLLWHVNQECVRRSSPGSVLLHAAAAVRSGVGVVLPAPMEHGKTTTVTGLLRHGYAYVTDEAVCLDPVSLQLSAFPKALSIDAGSWPVFPDLEPGLVLTDHQWQVPVSSFGTIASAPVPLRLVVSPRYVAGASTELLPVSRAAMLMILAECCFEFVDRAERNLTALGRALTGADCYRLQIGDLDEAVRLIDGLVDAVAA